MPSLRKPAIHRRTNHNPACSARRRTALCGASRPTGRSTPSRPTRWMPALPDRERRPVLRPVERPDHHDPHRPGARPGDPPRLTQFLEFNVQTAGILADRTTSDRTGRTLSRDTGTGDVTLRARYNLFGDDDGKVAFTLIPFLSVPSGDRQFSNTRVEGGIAAPLGLSLPNGFTLILQSEVQGAARWVRRRLRELHGRRLPPARHPGREEPERSRRVHGDQQRRPHTADTYTFDTALPTWSTRTRSSTSPLSSPEPRRARFPDHERHRASILTREFVRFSPTTASASPD